MGEGLEKLKQRLPLLEYLRQQHWAARPTGYHTMAHTVCATPVPAISWMRDFRLKKSAITLVTARQG